MKNKRFIILMIVILILASMIVSCMACSKDKSNTDTKNMDVMSMAQDFLSADSFTVERDGVEIMKYNGNKIYWKDKYDTSMYDEYYFMPDGEGKYWVYKKGYSEEEWTKKSFTIDDYASYVYNLKITLGGSYYVSVFMLLDVLMDFDAFIQENDSTYKLISEFADFIEVALKLSKEDNKLAICASDREELDDDSGVTIKVSISKINETKIELSKSANEAKVGDITVNVYL